MPPPAASDPSILSIEVLLEPFFVIQFPTSEKLLPQLLSDIVYGSGTERLLSVTRTSEEISVVGESWKDAPEKVKGFVNWRCLKVRGPMEHGLIGVMAALTVPLKEAKVPVFTLSTWNTDYILVPMDLIDEAIEALKSDGWALSYQEFKL
ncbi:hypothetical protein AX16_007856 [Volvariella volvacea WC 439]|nr:hypothetical protein AX16_007856 [Volvariella volvacea WC 439]